MGFWVLWILFGGEYDGNSSCEKGLLESTSNLPGDYKYFFHFSSVCAQSYASFLIPCTKPFTLLLNNYVGYNINYLGTSGKRHVISSIWIVCQNLKCLIPFPNISSLELGEQTILLYKVFTKICILVSYQIKFTWLFCTYLNIQLQSVIISIMLSTFQLQKNYVLL